MPNAQQSTKQSETSSGIQWRFWIVTVIAAFLLLIANSAFWVNQYIFNTDNFTRVTTTAITAESSREAIASGVVDRLLTNQPALKRVVNDQAVKLISGLLDTKQADAVLDRAVTNLHVTLTSADPQSTVLDLTNLKNVMQRVIDVTNLEPTNFSVDDIPDQIVLLDANKVPHFYQYGVWFLWISPLAAIIGTLGFIYPYLGRGKKLASDWSIPVKQGLTVLVVGLFGLSWGPLFKPPVLANINTDYGRTVVGNIYDAFIATFNHQTMWLVYLGSMIFLIGVVWWILLNRRKFTS